jgi:hypothetical protein
LPTQEAKVIALGQGSELLTTLTALASDFRYNMPVPPYGLPITTLTVMFTTEIPKAKKNPY